MIFKVCIFLSLTIRKHCLTNKDMDISISYKNSEESKQGCSNIYAIKKREISKKSKRLYFYNISNTVSAFALLWCSSDRDHRWCSSDHDIYISLQDR